MQKSNTDTRHFASEADAVLNTAVDAVITINGAGIIKSINPAAERLFEYAPRELIGKNVSCLMPEPHRSQHDEYLKRYLATGDKHIIGTGRDIEGAKKSTSICPMHLSVSEFDLDGQKHFTGILHDLTARERMAAEFRKRSAFLETIYEHVPDAIFVCDTDHKIISANSAFSRILKIPAKDAIGLSARELFAAPADYDAIDFRSIGMVADHQTEPISVRLRRSGGDEFPAHLSCSAIQDATETTFAYLGMIRDVTLEHHRDQTVRQLQRVEAIGQLTGGIAHDFNNLLTVIIGNHELLEMRLEDTKNRELVGRANKAAEMGARLTERLLAFARQDRLEPVTLDLNHLVENTIDLVKRTLGASIELTTRWAKGPCTVRADPSALENAILNLVVNSRDAMPTGGQLIFETARVEIESELLDARLDITPGEYVRLSVSDTGHGITDDKIERVFDPFFTTKDTGRGTGLGLSMVYGFAKQSNGSLTIYSEVNKGTTVNLYLPHLTGVTTASRPSTWKTAQSIETSEHILVVEDNPQVRELTVDRLRELGYAVTVAHSGVAAKERLKRGEDFDMVFSDIVMPGGVSGFDLAGYILEHRPTIKVLLTSGFAEDVARREPASSDRFKLLRKPYGIAELSKSLRDVLDPSS